MTKTIVLPLFYQNIMTNLAKHIIILFTLFLVSSCKPKQELKITENNEKVIMLEKGGCYGRCPIYKVEIYDNGYMKFYGDKYIDKLGIYEKHLDKQAFNILYQKFNQSKFNEFQDNYESMVPDAALIKLSFKDKKNPMKTITGKSERPKAVKDLQLEIERIVAAFDWEVIEKKEPEKKTNQKQEQKLIENQLIIEPENGVVFSKWISEMKAKYGVRIIDRVSSNTSYWVITFDTKKVTGSELIKIFKADPAIRNVEFNKTVTQR